MTDRTIEQLEEIIAERQKWAAEAHDKDLHGTAKEWELTIEIAQQLINLIDKWNDVDVPEED